MGSSVVANSQHQIKKRTYCLLEPEFQDFSQA
jgi:hypothetical protein